MRTVFTVFALSAFFGLQSMGQGGKTSATYKQIYPIASKQLESKKVSAGSQEFLGTLRAQPQKLQRKL
jgi:hypothetical protein